MKNQKKKSFPRRVFLCLLAVLLAVYVAFGVYVSDYYHADPAAEDALAAWMNLQSKAKYPDHFPVCHRRMAGTFFRIP